MEHICISSGEDFEEFSLRTFECFLQGDLFPYSLRETFDLVFTSWDEAVKELLNTGVEGFSYQKSPDGDDYLMCMQGFTQHVVMYDKTLNLLATYCNSTYKQLMTIFDIPVRYETKSVRKEDGRMRIVQEPVNGYHPKVQDPRHSGFMESSGDLVAKASFDRFLQKSGFTWSTANIAEAFGMPEEGLLCILKQNGIIIENDREDKNRWKLAEALTGNGFTLVKSGQDGKAENQWTYKGFFFLWLLLTKDCGIRPCCERQAPQGEKTTNRKN